MTLDAALDTAGILCPLRNTQVPACVTIEQLGEIAEAFFSLEGCASSIFLSLSLSLSLFFCLLQATGRRSTLSPIFGCNQSHSSPGLWAATAASYCPSRPVELPKLIATEYRTQGAAPPCTSVNVNFSNMSLLGALRNHSLCLQSKTYLTFGIVQAREKSMGAS